jgi:tetratricopeptide (TPR) repeat protein
MKKKNSSSISTISTPYSTSTREESLSVEYLDSAESSWNKGKRMRAVDLAREAWNLYPYERNLFSEIRGELNEQYGDLEKAKSELKAKIAGSPDRGMSCTVDSVCSFRQLSRISASRGEWDEAETYCLYAIGFSNNCVEAGQLCNFLGLIYLKKGDLENASQAFCLTRHHDPDNRGIFLHKAAFFLKKGELLNALTICIEGLSVMPSNRHLMLMLGKITAEYFHGNLGEAEFNSRINTQYTQEKIFASETECGCGAKSFLYSSPLGRKIYWISRAADTADKYLSKEGGYEILRSIISFVLPGRILEIGCGSGRNFSLYTLMGIERVIGQDISPAALELAGSKLSPNIELTSVPVPQLDYKEKYFDLVISNHVLQHIPGDSIEPVIEAICRMGKFVFINEATSAEVGNYFESFYMFVHDYSVLFEKYGFKILREVKTENHVSYLFGK